MRGNGPLLLILSVVLLPLLCLYITFQGSVPPKTFILNKFTFNAPKTDDKQPLKLTPLATTKLNNDIAEVAHKESPFFEMRDPSISVRKGTVQVVYLSSERIPDALRTILQNYITQRLLEISREK